MTAREISIPVEDPRQLGEFIAGLLGQRRSIERQFDGRRFKVDFDWLHNLDSIIDQRLSAQNEAVLVSFSARFYFANGKVITLHDKMSFNAFHDISDELSLGVDLNWSYLIKFPLVATPEKQEIRFSAFTQKEILERKPSDTSSKTPLVAKEERESLFYDIQFTNITWGEDLSAHIGNYIKSKTEPVAKWKAFLRRLPRSSFFPAGMLFGILAVFLATMWSLEPPKNLVAKYGDIGHLKAGILTIDQKLNFLVDVEVSRRRISFGSFLLTVVSRCGLIFAGLSAAILLLGNRPASFVILNEHSRRMMEKHEKRYEYFRYGLLSGFVVSVLAAIFVDRFVVAIGLMLGGG